MTDPLNPTDPTRRHEPHLEDDPAAMDAFLAQKKAEHERQQADRAAWDKSVAFFNAKMPLAAPGIHALRAQLDAQSASSPASTLSQEHARELTAHANQMLALYGGNVRPPASPPTPPSPAPELSSEEVLAMRIAAERDFQNGMRSGSLSPNERAAHEAKLRSLEHEADATSHDPERRKIALYQDLAELGAPRRCRPTDTVESLTKQRDDLLAARAAKEHDAAEHHATIGLDGMIGTPDEVALYEAQQRLNTFPSTGTGVLLVGIASARRASVEELRAAGARGDMLEGLGGGAAHVVENARARTERELDSTERSVAGRLPHDGNSPKPQVNGTTLKNWRSAFQSFPLSPALAAQYPAGVRFKANGFPDFSPYARATVRLQGLTGKGSVDFPRANKEAGFARTPKHWTWHHVEDGETMQLVPSDLHNAARHTGGNAIIKARAEENRP